MAAPAALAVTAAKLRVAWHVGAASRAARAASLPLQMPPRLELPHAKDHAHALNTAIFLRSFPEAHHVHAGSTVEQVPFSGSLSRKKAMATTTSTGSRAPRLPDLSVAETLIALEAHRSVPPAVPGIMLLSGGLLEHGPIAKTSRDRLQ